APPAGARPATPASGLAAGAAAGAAAGLAGGAAGPLRIVLFGLPEAGKSALLAALGQVQQSHPSLLQGELSDESGGLARQRALFYDAQGRPADAETAAYHVRFRPAAARGASEAVLIDSDGRVVQEMLGAGPPADEDSPRGTLPRAVLDADALVLAIDAAAPPELAERVFADFASFLRRFELERGRRSEATGLPVFLVLTKCDLL